MYTQFFKNTIWILTFLLLTGTGSFSFGQNFYMSSGPTIVTCGPLNFYDSGGPAGNYAPNQNFTRVICPEDTSSNICILVSEFLSETNFDRLTIYSGNGTTGEILAILSGSPSLLLNTEFVSLSGDGCITLNWISDGSSSYSGFVGLLRCKYPCQSMQIDFVKNLQMCDQIAYNDSSNSITAQISFPENDMYYHQSTSNVQYQWYVNSQLVSTDSIFDGFTFLAGYNQVALTVIDNNFCSNTSNFGIYFGDNLSLVITSPENLETFIIGQNINLQVDSAMHGQSQVNYGMSNTCFIPDGSGVEYTYNFNIFDFNPNQTIQDGSEISSFCLNMEHSYIGDLIVFLECPNGDTCLIFDGNSSNNLSAYLGEPIDDDNNTSHGVGYQYCWTENALNLITDNNMSSVSIPAGGYHPESSYSNLAGCPFNGQWTIHVIDDQGSDNGYIFGSELNFSPDFSVVPVQQHLYNANWSENGVILDSGFAATTNPTEIGQHVYDFSATDSCGHTFNYTVTVNVIDTPAFVTGHVFIDENLNCLADSAEPNQNQRIVVFEPGPYFATTNENGLYMAMLPEGTYSASLAPKQYHSTVCPQEQSIPINAIRGDTLMDINFGDTIIEVSDFSVQMSSSQLVLGATYEISIQVKNNSNTSSSGNLSLQKNAVLNFSHSTRITNSVNDTLVTWNIPTLSAWQSYWITAYFNMPFNIDFLDSNLFSVANVAMNGIDANSNNDTATIFSRVQSSYDPNMKEVFPAGVDSTGGITESDSILTYKIHFQNTGNIEATNLVIKDTLSHNVEAASFVAGQASHAYTWSLNGQGVVTFFFDNIFLPDITSDEAHSHGFVSYTVHVKPEVPVGTIIKNTANIFFDYNPNVRTNTTTNTIVDPLFIQQTEYGSKLSVYPNPTSGRVEVNAGTNGDISRCSLFDMQGREYKPGLIRNTASHVTVDLSGLTPGVYLLKVNAGGTWSQYRVVKL